MAPNDLQASHDKKEQVAMDGSSSTVLYMMDMGDEWDYFNPGCAFEDKGYHDLYLQRFGSEFVTPIVYQDGMDHIECELYYSSVRSQNEGGVLRRMRSPYIRRPCIRNLEEYGSIRTKPSPCIRKSRYSNNTVPTTKSQKQGRRQARRCSFTSFPQEEEEHARSLRRSYSNNQLEEYKPRIAFEEYVQVFTIHPISEYPSDVRVNLWMSPEEMAAGVRRAMMDDSRRERARQRDLELQRQQQLEKENMRNVEGGKAEKKRVDDNPVPEEDQDEKRVERTPSVDSVIAECIRSVQLGEQ